MVDKSEYSEDYQPLAIGKCEFSQEKEHMICILLQENRNNQMFI